MKELKLDRQEAFNHGRVLQAPALHFKINA